MISKNNSIYFNNEKHNLFQYRIMLNGFGYALFGVPTRDLESTWRDPEDLENTAGENGQDPLLITTVMNNVSKY